MEKNTNEAVASKKSKRPLKVFVVGGSLGYANWITNSQNLVNSVDEADLVLLTGGEDVNPKYYNERVHPSTHFTNRDAEEFRIINESISKKKPLYGTCRGLQILTVAAGGKLVQHQSNRYSPHLMADVINKDLPQFKEEYLFLKSTIFTLRNAYFPLFYDTKSLQLIPLQIAVPDLFKVLQQIPIITTSAHHQAAYPYNLPEDQYKILAWTRGLHLMHENGDKEELDMPEELEIEAAYYPKINAFGIQGHPEWMVSECENSISQFAKEIETGKNIYLEFEKLITKNSVIDIDQFRTKGVDIIKNLDAFIKSNINESKVSSTALSYFKSYLYFYVGLKHIINDETIEIGSSLIKNSLITFIKSILIYDKLTIFKNYTIGYSTSKLKNVLKNGLFNEDLTELSESILDELISKMYSEIFPKKSNNFSKIQSTASTLYERYNFKTDLQEEIARVTNAVLEMRKVERVEPFQQEPINEEYFDEEQAQEDHF